MKLWNSVEDEDERLNGQLFMHQQVVSTSNGMHSHTLYLLSEYVVSLFETKLKFTTLNPYSVAFQPLHLNRIMHSIARNALIYDSTANIDYSFMSSWCTLNCVNMLHSLFLEKPKLNTFDWLMMLRYIFREMELFTISTVVFIRIKTPKSFSNQFLHSIYKLHHTVYVYMSIHLDW